MKKENYGMDLPDFIESFCNDMEGKDLKTIAEEVWEFGNARYSKGYNEHCSFEGDEE